MALTVPLLLYHLLVTLIAAVSIVLGCAKWRKKKEVSARPLAVKEPDWEQPPPSQCPQIGVLTPPEPRKQAESQKSSTKSSLNEKEQQLRTAYDDEDMILLDPAYGDPRLKTAYSFETTQTKDSKKQKKGSRESEKEQSAIDQRDGQLRSARDDETLENVVTNFGDEHTVRQRERTMEQTSGRQTEISQAEQPAPSIAEAQKQMADSKKRSSRRAGQNKKGSGRRQSLKDKMRRRGSKKETHSAEREQESDGKGRSERDEKGSKKPSQKSEWTKRENTADTKIIEATQFSSKRRTK